MCGCSLVPYRLKNHYLMIHLNNFILRFPNGGYLKRGSNQVGVFKTGFAWVNVWKLNFPWYPPIPLLPMPPNGTLSFAKW